MVHRPWKALKLFKKFFDFFFSSYTFLYYQEIRNKKQHFSYAVFYRRGIVTISVCFWRFTRESVVLKNICGFWLRKKDGYENLSRPRVLPAAAITFLCKHNSTSLDYTKEVMKILLQHTDCAYYSHKEEKLVGEMMSHGGSFLYLTTEDWEVVCNHFFCSLEVDCTFIFGFNYLTSWWLEPQKWLKSTFFDDRNFFHWYFCLCLSQQTSIHHETWKDFFWTTHKKFKIMVENAKIPNTAG